MGHKRKHENGDVKTDVANLIDGPDASSTGEMTPELRRKRKFKSSRDRYALYLVRKPIEVTLNDLSQAGISLEVSDTEEEMVTIGDGNFIIRGTGLPSQTFHIPASIIHAPDGSSSAETSTVTGSVLISRAEFNKSEDIFEEGNDVPLDFAQSLPLKSIKKKVSRKSLKNLRQRLSATGVKRLKNESNSVEEDT